MSQKVPLPGAIARIAPKVHVRMGLTRTADGRLVSRSEATSRRGNAWPTGQLGVHNDPVGPQSIHDTRKDALAAGREVTQGSLPMQTAVSAANDVDIVVVDIELPSLGAEYEHAVKEFAQQLPVLLVTAQHDQFEQRARSLLQAYPLPDPLGDAHLANFRDELLARQRYLQTVPCWTSKDVADAARHVNKNASSTAHRWKSDGKIFAIPAAGKRDVYPAFQFKDGKPREVITELLKILEEARTPWEIAQWFVAANGWLDGDRPIDLLDDPKSRDLLIDAAQQEVATNVG
jgi:hypothetical protein